MYNMINYYDLSEKAIELMMKALYQIERDKLDNKLLYTQALSKRRLHFHLREDIRKYEYKETWNRIAQWITVPRKRLLNFINQQSFFLMHMKI